jgi:hydrogenase maturation protein HypF
MNGEGLLRVQVAITGAVQGVGFRPFVYRLARDLRLGGWVRNSAQGVLIEAEGTRPKLDEFLLRVKQDKPPRSIIETEEHTFLDPAGYSTFDIDQSDAVGVKTTLVQPDIATCPDCLSEISDPANRRSLYPFTNCTNCGPRYSIIEALPYDRPHTAMKTFGMCDECWAEYQNPLDRRFHAQPNACPNCGPHLELWVKSGRVLAEHHRALLCAADAIRSGSVVAIKGLGGFQLVVDARKDAAVKALRLRKHREEKPFALMYPSLDLVRQHCDVSDLEERLLCSPEAPIVLLRRKANVTNLADAVAPGNPYLGVMLPYTPLHYILMAELHFPIVATSGNLTDEPICIDEFEALERLGGIADVFLVHNRPIVRHVDDSVVQVVAGREMILRRARGYAPLPTHVQEPLPPLVAVGAHLKNTVAISRGQHIFVSQHIGDLETTQAFEASKRVAADLQKLYELQPVGAACDLHPDYLSTQAAKYTELPVVRVQHHYAHVLACMADHGIEPPVLGVSWDGTGYGTDGTIWGGEFLRVNDNGFERFAHLRTFRLPGGDQAVKEPRRTAIGLLYEMFGDGLFTMDWLPPVQAFSAKDVITLKAMLNIGVNSPITSSAGRLFDAVAAILGLHQKASFEGQAAMALEFAIEGFASEDAFPVDINGEQVDWLPAIGMLLDDKRNGVPIGLISAKFHNTLAEMILAVARHAGEQHIVLTGGCFQNRYLLERTIRRLQDEQFVPHWHQHVPTNDGGIAVGQIMAAAREIELERGAITYVPGSAGKDHDH